MRKLAVGLTILTAAVTGGVLTGCAAGASTSTSTGKSSTGATAAAASASAAAKAALGGLSNGGSGAPAQWLVDGTFQTKDAPAQPMSGTVTFRDGSTGKSVSVSVGPSGQFTLGLMAGTYTATPEAKGGSSACAAPVAVTVRAGKQTKVSLACATS